MDDYKAKFASCEKSFLIKIETNQRKINILGNNPVFLSFIYFSQTNKIKIERRGVEKCFKKGK